MKPGLSQASEHAEEEEDEADGDGPFEVHVMTRRAIYAWPYAAGELNLYWRYTDATTGAQGGLPAASSVEFAVEATVAGALAPGGYVAFGMACQILPATS
jgi:hypothetical protein